MGYTLFQTYWDELGNGIEALNHPKIYRDGLRDMDFELAPPVAVNSPKTRAWTKTPSACPCIGCAWANCR